LPKVSIITVVYNGASVLPFTLESVKAQTFTDYEYIIIDGASEDGTLDVIKANEKYITTWVSEKDKGLYDAMNKAILLARGEYLWFINAGDLIYEPQTLEKIFANNPPADIYYGDAVIIDDKFQIIGKRDHKKLPERLRVEDMLFGMVVCHQSILVRKKIAPFYDLAHPYSADIDWTIKALQKATTVCNTRLILSKFQAGGVSAKKRKSSLQDRFSILCKHFGLFRTLWAHFIILFKYLFSPKPKY
jgi:glycosyltransferase involved in cell wall biosynthesis